MWLVNGIIHTKLNHEREAKPPMEVDSSSDETGRTVNTKKHDHIQAMGLCMCWTDQLRL